MKTTNYSTSIPVLTVSALVFNEDTESASIKSYELVGNVSASEAKKLLAKRVKGNESVVKIKSTSARVILATCPVDIVSAHAKHLTRRGEDGRTREPVFTRTLERTVVNALVFNEDTESASIKSYELVGNVSASEAKKLLAKRVKSNESVVKIKSTSVLSDVLELKLIEFYELAKKHGELRELSEDELREREEAREAARAAREAARLSTNEDEDEYEDESEDESDNA